MKSKTNTKAQKLGSAIRRMRHVSSMTLADLAKQASISVGTLRNAEVGIRLSDKTLDRVAHALAHALGVTVENIRASAAYVIKAPKAPKAPQVTAGDIKAAFKAAA